MTAAHTARGGAVPPQPRPQELVRTPGWTWNKRPECPVYLGLWFCAVCIRSGWDLRRMFCPFNGGD
jgi:hypothetical protein